MCPCPAQVVLKGCPQVLLPCSPDSTDLTGLITTVAPSTDPLSPNPRSCPSMPRGFGTGHSFFCCKSALSELMGALAMSCVSRFCLRSFVLISPLSLSCRRLTGQDRRCGMPTTKNETAKHPVKSVDVDRDRGWRIGGIFGMFGSSRYQLCCCIQTSDITSLCLCEVVNVASRWLGHTSQPRFVSNSPRGKPRPITKILIPFTI